MSAAAGARGLTIFAIPRAFEGEAARLQRRAVQSWARVPGAEIVLFGDEPGIAEAAAQAGAMHVPEIERTALGTPLVSSAFGRVHELSTSPLLCYVNADIVFAGDVAGALGRVDLPRFLLIGRCSGRARALGADYFFFPADGEFARIPPFAVGRPGWDNWMLLHARRNGIPLIDATAAIGAVHLEHGYDHVPAGSGADGEGPEADANRALRRAAQADPSSVAFSVRDATHALTSRGVRRKIGPTRLWRRYRTRRELGR